MSIYLDASSMAFLLLYTLHCTSTILFWYIYSCIAFIIWRFTNTSNKQEQTKSIIKQVYKQTNTE